MPVVSAQKERPRPVEGRDLKVDPNEARKSPASPNRQSTRFQRRWQATAALAELAAASGGCFAGGASGSAGSSPPECRCPIFASRLQSSARTPTHGEQILHRARAFSPSRRFDSGGSGRLDDPLTRTVDAAT